MKHILSMAVALFCLTCPVLLMAQKVSQGSTATQDTKVSAVDVAVQDQKVPYDQAPEPTKQVVPKYPEEATKARTEGTVWTQVWIDESGNVTKATVTKSDAEIFNQPAVDAAMQWKFKPAKKDGKPIAVWVSIPFRFKIMEGGEVSDYTKPGVYLQVGVRPNSPYRIIRQHPYLTGQAPSSTTNWYPESAIKDGFEGIVTLDVTVSATGKVERVVVSGVAREDLDSAAVRLARTWLFTPAQMGGMPEKAVIRVPVGFHLPRPQK